MNINNVSGQNFLTLGEFSINLKDRGLLLIQGVNDDDPSADSNGAGKSSLPDAISWALYGTTARGITGDAVINRKVGKLCGVVVTVEDGDTQYVITRTRAPNSLTVKERGPHGPVIAESDLTKGTQSETQEVINKIMGCGIEVFNAAVYAGQDAMPDLPGMTDKQLKLLIEEAAGVEVLAAAYSIALQRANNAEKLAASGNASVNGLLIREAAYVSSLTRYDIEGKKFEDQKIVQIKGLRGKAMMLLRDKKELDETVSETDSVALHQEIVDYESADKSNKGKLSDSLKLANTAEIEVRGRLHSHDRDIAGIMRQIMESNVELATAEARIGEACGECGKPIIESDIAAVKEALSIKIDAAQLRRDSIKPESRAALEKELKEAQAKMDAASSALANYGDMSSYKALIKKMADHNVAKARAGNLAVELDGVAKQLLEVTKTVSPYTGMKEADTKSLEITRLEISEINSLLTLRESERDLLLEATKIFGQSGVRAHILDTVTPFLNDRTSEYLGSMTDGNIHAVWNTLQKTAKGELRERFNIEVTNDMGAESFAGLSGGEKRKVRLATTMALQDMVASRAEKPLNIWIADEIDNALDESGLERLMMVLEKKARERGTVLVISHNSLSDWCDNIVTVTKKAGISTISES